MAKRFPVAKVGELKDGMKEEVSAGETRLVLARVGDHYYAFQARCPPLGLAPGQRQTDRDGAGMCLSSFPV